MSPKEGWRIGGLDEVGKGSLAGPLVVVAYVVSATTKRIPGAVDSKKLKHEDRRVLVPKLTKAALDVGIGSVEAWDINRLGIVEAWKRACKKALLDLDQDKLPHLLYVDGDEWMGFHPRWLMYQVCQPKADRDIWQVAAAANIAKWVRDLDMEDLAEEFPDYGWERNRGYGTPEHQRALRRVGPCEHHRQQFIRRIMEE